MLEIAVFPELTFRKLAAKDWQRAKLAAKAGLAAREVGGKGSARVGGNAGTRYQVCCKKLRKLVGPIFFEFLSSEKDCRVSQGLP
jgi:hypothetical protein